MHASCQLRRWLQPQLTQCRWASCRASCQPSIYASTSRHHYGTHGLEESAKGGGKCEFESGSTGELCRASSRQMRSEACRRYQKTDAGNATMAPQHSRCRWAGTAAVRPQAAQLHLIHRLLCMIKACFDEIKFRIELKPWQRSKNGLGGSLEASRKACYPSCCCSPLGWSLLLLASPAWLSSVPKRCAACSRRSRVFCCSRPSSASRFRLLHSKSSVA